MIEKIDRDIDYTAQYSVNSYSEHVLAVVNIKSGKAFYRGCDGFNDVDDLVEKSTSWAKIVYTLPTVGIFTTPHYYIIGRNYESGYCIYSNSYYLYSTHCIRFSDNILWNIQESVENTMIDAPFREYRNTLDLMHMYNDHNWFDVKYPLFVQDMRRKLWRLQWTDPRCIYGKRRESKIVEDKHLDYTLIGMFDSESGKEILSDQNIGRDIINQTPIAKIKVYNENSKVPHFHIEHTSNRYDNFTICLESPDVLLGNDRPSDLLLTNLNKFMCMKNGINSNITNWEAARQAWYQYKLTRNELEPQDQYRDMDQPDYTMIQA